MINTKTGLGLKLIELQQLGGSKQSWNLRKCTREVNYEHENKIPPERSSPNTK